MSEQRDITSNIDLLLGALPDYVRASLDSGPDNKEDLLEIVMDLGRLPEARYRDRERFLSDHEVTQEDIEYVISRIGMFGEDNRAGIPRTLHRISGIRNRSGKVIGLTCRVGRAIFGTITILRDLIESGKSVLLLGRPGVGKTTMLRETARVLAEELRKRVVIVDTSNEIAGDGDIPHPGIGRARRMQVPRPSEQHAVMIEAVENHMPEVIVIDEIGTELEAQAARTIAERGVQLIGTAHGNTLDNLMVNPTLSDLIGGIQAVTLGDEEARRRGTQKTVLERKAPPTFDVLVELQSWEQVIVYPDVASAVDSLLRSDDPPVETRQRNADGTIGIERSGGGGGHRDDGDGTFGSRRSNAPWRERGHGRDGRDRQGGQPWRERERGASFRERNGSQREGRFANNNQSSPAQPQRIFPFGVSRDRLERAIGNLRVPASIVRDMSEATMVMTLKNYYRQGSERVRQAEDRGVPVYVLRNNTITQMERQLVDVFHLATGDDDEETGDEETQARLEMEQAISQVLNGEEQAVELPPRSNYIRKLQHQMAERYNVRTESQGREPHRRIKVSRG
ncbi:MAG TPA: R3H domain-containing nucleic acid-binding protein [Roseiflexaceae bacterium]|nr:R3H domain-containing nucleic acid-binding protein [Roseiflexaceae bacterium]